VRKVPLHFPNRPAALISLMNMILSLLQISLAVSSPPDTYQEVASHKNMYTELSKTVHAYCRCRNKERAWSTPPKACLGFRGLSRRLSPRVTISILSHLPSAASRLRETICQYAAMTDVVGAILVQWNNNKLKAPSIDNCANLARSNGIVVETLTYEQNTLLNRYTGTQAMGPLTMLQDDDVRYSEHAVRAFVAVAALFPKSIVGVNGRMAVAYESPEATAKYFHPDKAPGRYLNDSRYRIDGKNTSKYLYNMATGTTSILQRSLIERFMDVPQASKDYISSHKPTCEDITLHFLASNMTRQPPIWFRLHHDDGGELDKLGDGDGLEMHLHVINWTDLRARCVDRVASDFGQFPLVQTNCRLDLHRSQLRHMDPAVW